MKAIRCEECGRNIAHWWLNGVMGDMIVSLGESIGSFQQDVPRPDNACAVTSTFDVDEHKIRASFVNLRTLTESGECYVERCSRDHAIEEATDGDL